MAGFGFNTQEYVREQSNFDPIPAGDYKLRITESQMKTSAKGNDYLSITFAVAEGPFSNRLIWANFNIFHPNNDTQRIAREQIAELCAAAGRPNANDSSQIHGCVVLGKVKCDPSSDFPNSIKGYRKINGDVGNAQSRPAQPGQSAVTTPPSTTTSRSSKPWERKAS